MSITCDGERSKARRWYASKLLNVAREMGLPAMKKIWGGFTFSVTNVDPDLEMGRVTAPAGAVVLCSQDSGVEIHTSEWVFSGVGPKQELQDFTDVSGTAVVKYVPDDYTYLTVGSLPPIPALSELGGEAYVAALSGSHASNQYTYGARARFYLPGVAPLGGGAYYLSFTPMPRPSVQMLRASFGFIGMSVNSGRYIASSASSTELTSSSGLVTSAIYGVLYPTIPLDTQFAGVPSGLRAAMTHKTLSNTVSVGGYAFNSDVDYPPVIMNVADASAEPLVISPPPSNPDYSDWYVFCSIYDVDAGTVATFNSTNIVPSLVAIFGSFTTSDQAAVRARLGQLIGWPTQRDSTPPDTAMFHDDGGNIYTWTRKYGSAKWSDSTGLSATSLTMPAAVTGTNGVRPEVYNLGGGKFLCIAFKPGKLRVYGADADERKAKLADWIGVRGLYYGSPFSSWEEIPLPDPATYRTLTVRAIKVTDVERVFTAVVSDIPDANDPDPPQPKHWFAMRLGDQWRILSPIQTDVTDRDRVFWATGLYGDDPMVKDMADCPAKPVAYPQAVVLPYTEYAGVIP